MNKNREFHELLGYCWHEWTWSFDDLDTGVGSWKCKKCGEIVGIQKVMESSLDYAADPRLVLREMIRINKWYEFWAWDFDKDYPPDDFGGVIMCGEQFLSRIEDYILDTTGKLRDLADNWLKAMEFETENKKFRKAT